MAHIRASRLPDSDPLQVMSKVQPLEIAEDAESEEAAEVGEPDAAE